MLEVLSYGWLAFVGGLAILTVGVVALCACMCNRRKCRRRWTAVKQWPRRLKRGTLWAIKWGAIGVAGVFLIGVGMRLVSWSLKERAAPPVSRNPYYRPPPPPPLGVPLPGAIPLVEPNIVQFGVAGDAPTHPKNKNKRQRARNRKRAQSS